MTQETFEEANRLNNELHKYNKILNSLSYTYNGVEYSTNPEFVIMVDSEDGESREKIHLPVEFNEKLIELVKDLIIVEAAKLRREFQKL